MTALRETYAEDEVPPPLPIQHPEGWPVSVTSWRRGCRCKPCEQAMVEHGKRYRASNRRVNPANPMDPPSRPRRSLKYRDDGTPYPDTMPPRQ